MLLVDQIDVFYGDAQALDGVSLEVPQGAIVAIGGANGAGKTSLIRTIAGMVKPARGLIRFRDNDIAGWPSYRVCNLGIGQVAEGRQIFPNLSVSENLDMGAMIPRARATRDRNRERVLSMFPRLRERLIERASIQGQTNSAADERIMKADALGQINECPDGVEEDCLPGGSCCAHASD